MEGNNLILESQVKQFLLETRIALAKQGGLVFIDREKNVRAMAELGLLLSDVPGFVHRLEVRDYVSGPTDDDKGRQEKWWVFSREICKRAMYIKIALLGGGFGVFRFIEQNSR